MKTRKLFAWLLVLALALSLLTACGGGKQDNVSGVAPKGSVLMSDSLDGDLAVKETPNQSVFGSPSLKRGQVRSVTFLSDTSQAAEGNWDVSGAQDGSVLAWTTQNGEFYDLYIAGEGGVTAPENCAYLFCGYCNMTGVSFNGLFDTSGVTDMSHMFLNCALTTLDVSGFDTANVTDMSGMFDYCCFLETLDVSGFDTSNVTDMSWMFPESVKLTPARPL